MSVLYFIESFKVFFSFCLGVDVVYEPSLKEFIIRLESMCPLIFQPQS